MTSQTYATSLSFSDRSEALAHLAMFDYAPLPVRNRFTNRSVGDFGEARIGFATVEATDDGVTIHEVDMPLKRG